MAQQVQIVFIILDAANIYIDSVTVGTVGAA